ncbi:hypothetical protein BUPH_08389 (plasmid) [Paraburkholderia phenoliruptrix BR3459a]|uniref:Uncharacterized protein n=1 Tax=Paraburkholderia phenoliruptrix BR3459a TaxID=1229205 RepID=K0E0U3_9BURK|nr:hypothetical protein BUPH_08389 [Paraburkholderia phenoliruptrix BR3459a]
MPNMSMREAEKLPNATSTEPTLPPACSTAISVMWNPAIEKQAARPRLPNEPEPQRSDAPADYGSQRAVRKDAGACP